MFEHGARVNPLTFNVNTFTTEASNLPYMDLPTLGRRIRQWRKEAGFRTQKALADAVGCERATVTMWETDKVDRVGGEYLGALAIALGKSPQVIQTGREGKLTREGSTAPASPQLAEIRERDAIQSLRIFVGAMATVMASTRPDEGEALLSLVRSAAGADEFVNQGLGVDLVRAVERGIALAKARQSSRRRGAA
jgi:transcriptional regulator with XRE-family HTH domain